MKVCGAERPAEIRPLRFLAAVTLQKIEVFARFHSVGGDPQPQSAAQSDDGIHDGAVCGCGGDVSDVRAQQRGPARVGPRSRALSQRVRPRDSVENPQRCRPSDKWAGLRTRLSDALTATLEAAPLKAKLSPPEPWDEAEFRRETRPR